MRPQGLKQGAGSVLDARVLTGVSPGSQAGAVLAQELSHQGSSGTRSFFFFFLVLLWQVALPEGG